MIARLVFSRVFFIDERLFMFILSVTNQKYESAIVSCYTGHVFYLFYYLFPDNYFRDNYCFTMDVQKRLRDQERKQNSKSHRSKPEFPMLFIEPNLNIAEGSFDQLERHMGRYSNEKTIGGVFSVPMVYDDLGDVCLVGAGIRRRYEFGVKLVHDSTFETLDAHSKILQDLPNGMRFHMDNMPVEVVIPNKILHTIANMRGWNLDNELDVLKLQAYMNEFSQGSVNYVRLKSSGKKVFTYLYETKMEIGITGISAAELLTRKNKSRMGRRSSVEIGMWVEGLVPGKFVLRSTDWLNYVPEDSQDTRNFIDQTDSIVNVTLTKDTPRNTLNNKSLVSYETLQGYSNETIITLKDFMNPNFIKVIKLEADQLSTNDFNDVFEMKIFKEGVGELDSSEWSIDWSIDEPTITLNNAKPYIKYKIAMWLSLSYFGYKSQIHGGSDASVAPFFESYTKKQKRRYIRYVALEPKPDGAETQFSMVDSKYENWELLDNTLKLSVDAPYVLDAGKRSITYNNPPASGNAIEILEAIIQPISE